MGILSNIIIKGISTAARNSTIRVAGEATANIIAAKSDEYSKKEDIVVKNGITLIRPTRSSDDYYGKDAMEIAYELLGAGFERVNLEANKKLGAGSKRKYGKIESISINGKTDFIGVKRIPASSYIVIKFLDFKKNVDSSVYENVCKMSSGVLYHKESKGNIQENDKIEDDINKKFCPYCGQSLISVSAKFCSKC